MTRHGTWLALALFGCATASPSKPAAQTTPAKESERALPTTGDHRAEAEPDAGPLRPFTMLGGRVTGQLPVDWKAQDPGEGLKGKADREALQFFIPYPETDNTPDSANALVLAFEVPADMTVSEFSDQLIGESMDPKKGGAAAVKDVTEGRWRLVIGRGMQEQTPYALFHRFGVGNGVGVDLLVAVPIMENGNAATVERIVAQFGTAGDSLTLVGTPAR